MISKRLVQNLDWWLLAVVLALLGFGIVVIFSATRTAGGGGHPYAFVVRQVVSAALSLALLAGTISVDYRVFKKWATPFYLAMLTVLAVVLVLGRSAMGAQRWISLGPFGSFQPSELAKLAVILFVASRLDDVDDLSTLKSLLPIMAYVGLPAALVLLQPDLGTALVFAGLFFAMLYIAGASPKHLGGIVAAGALISPLAFFFLLRPYQQARLIAFFDPFQDPLGNGYNVIQALIAVGSGQLLGKGLLGGSQTQSDFVPENHTDFIFSAVGEEFGFIGAMVLVAAYYFILRRGVNVIGVAKDRFGALLATGVVTMLLLHVVINVGMNLGIMPVAGIPLPFVSYGGSSLLTNVIAVGILLNVHMRRQKILF